MQSVLFGRCRGAGLLPFYGIKTHLHGLNFLAKIGIAMIVRMITTEETERYRSDKLTRLCSDKLTHVKKIETSLDACAFNWHHTH